MAKSTPVKKAWRSLSWLGVIVVVLLGTLTAGVLLSNATWLPKLALDLEGGTQIILSPQVQNGQSVQQEQLDQAVSIIRQRIDASGVSEAQISTEGSRNIVVSLPGKPDQATLDRVKSSARLDFRAVLVAGGPTNEVVGADGKSTPAPTPAPGLQSTPSSKPTNGSDLAWVTPKLQAEFNAYDCKANAKKATSAAPTDQPLITCDDQNTVKYLLGPVEVKGQDISDANAGLVQSSQGVTTGQWAVNIVFNGAGTKAFADVTTRLVALKDAQNQFAIVLDGKVISAPTTQAAITDGKPQITGNFTETTAKALADQLKFGALPFSFKVQSQDTISATLGTSQLLSGLIAGLIGLILVAIYTFFQYRLLGLVTIFSLVVAGALSWLTISLLSWHYDYRLSLAGVAGLIVAIGFTADSFIVYFERIRDELRDGRGLESAVEAGWARARRTIYASKATNLLAAVVLYVLAAANVRGFAFTLGLTTIIDVIVVLLFTHPTLQLLARTRFFSSGHAMSGLDPQALGAVYRGAARFRAPTATVGVGTAARSSKEAARRQTIAERKAAELAGATASSDRSTEGKDS
ncbi:MULTISPECIES: protein translocase subunit SecD [unclassified Leifsonia]|uniref:protein translocase subunit SecD n=1 Tax=unclassified Leifsonia TaxID=2663824 RepID=UPI0008A77A06|nr:MULTISPECIES: protein translocase subunit SecD [unclassified Leifsonia]SEH93782.1 preprotein translocase subunit SecD [Leifsonia sp. CL154]SFL59927.1 preprotein translocase subunit SecD [Leifsonia sp. CL147]